MSSSPEDIVLDRSAEATSTAAADTNSRFVGTLRAGFHLVARLANNSTPLRHVVFNTSRGIFTTTDEKGMRGWRVHPTHFDDFTFIPNAPKTTCFFSAVSFVESLAVYFVAALDGTLRVLDDRMHALSTFKWDPYQGAVLNMVYNPALDELITAGKSGIMFWTCVYDSRAATAWMNDNMRVGEKGEGASKASTSIFEGRRVPWRGGGFSEVVLRHKIDRAAYSSARTPTSAHDDADERATGSDAARSPWFSHMALDVRLQKLAVATERSVFIFAVDSGALLSRHIGIHSARIRDLKFIMHESGAVHTTDVDADGTADAGGGGGPMGHRVLVTCCSDGVVKLWRIRANGTTMKLLNVVSSFTSPVVSLCTLKGEKALLLGTDDGFIVLIDLETLEHLHRMKLPARCNIRHVAMTVKKDSAFYVQTEFDVFVFQLIDLYHTFGQFNSNVEVLECVGGGHTLCVCVFEDSAIRLISNKQKTTLPLSTTVPAMSRFSLRNHCYDSGSQMLYVVLSNGQVYVYDCSTNPSTEVEVWNALAKFRPLCAALVGLHPPAYNLSRTNEETPTSRYFLPAPQAIDFQQQQQRRRAASGSATGLAPLWPGLYRTGVSSSSSSSSSSKSAAAHTVSPADGSSSSSSGTTGVDDSAETDAHVVDNGGSTGSLNKYKRSLTNDPCVALLAVGTEDGDVLFIDTADHGAIRRTFPAHRNRPISRICYNYARRILVTAALRTVRVWSVSNLDLLLQVTYEDMVTCMEQLKGVLIVGLRSGSIRTIDLSTLQQDTLPIEGGHSAMVRDIGVSEVLDQFVTCCSQGLLKVFTIARDMKAECSLRLEQSISCICYQDNRGNLLAGLGNKIVRIRCKVLARAPNELTEAIKSEYSGFALGYEDDEPSSSTERDPGAHARIGVLRDGHKKTSPATETGLEAHGHTQGGRGGAGEFSSYLYDSDVDDADVGGMGGVSSADEDDDVDYRRRAGGTIDDDIDAMSPDKLDEAVASIVQASSNAARTTKTSSDAPKPKKSKKKKRRRKPKALGITSGGTRIDPAVQIGLLELKCLEADAIRIMRKTGISCTR